MYHCLNLQEYIRRARQRAAKLRMLLEEQKKNYGIEEH